MTAVNGTAPLAPTTIETPTTASTATAPATADSANISTDAPVDFGAAVKVTLSPPAQTVVQESTAAQPAAPAAAAPAAPAPKGGEVGGAPVAASSDASAALIKSAERKAALQVGVADASSVVSKDGTISTVAVNKILAEQAAKKA